MKKKQWNYQIGGKPQGLIPTLFLLALFGGLTIWLYMSHNGAFLFGMILTVLALAILFAVIYRAIFVKLLIGEDGFYHQTKPGNGRHYKYSQIKKAWESSGKGVNGVENSFCNYETYDGRVVRFPFFPYESDGVDYLMERINDKASGGCGESMSGDPDEYRMDGKPYGITSIVIAAVLLVIFILLEGPIIRYEISEGFLVAALFCGTGILLALVVLIKSVVQYCCFKVKIDRAGFYFQSNPFNGAYYKYSDIQSCREELKSARHGRIGERGTRVYFYFFFFTDRNGRTTKFRFQKDIHEREIAVLKERIEKAKE